MAKLLTLPLARIEDANGVIYPGALLDAFLTGTTTPASVYTDATLDTPLANPVVADAGGFLPPIFLDPAVIYRFRVRSALGVAISGMDFDPVSSLESEFINPPAYGAKGDGTTDDTTAIVAAITAAAAAGKWLDGGGKTYAVTGKISAVSNLWMRDLTLKQLAPGASDSVVTLACASLDGVRLLRVAVDRNGDGTNGGFADDAGINGCLNSAYGIKITSCTNSTFDDLEVYGNDTGTGILFSGLDHTNAVRGWNVHDILGINTSDVHANLDENVAGVVFSSCDGLQVIGGTSRDFTVRDSASVTLNNQTRGISLSHNDGLTIFGGVCKNVGEAFDISGGSTGGTIDPNENVHIIGAKVYDAYSWGFKTAGYCRRVHLTDCIAVRCRAAGFVDSSGDDTPTSVLDRNSLNNCQAIDTGYGGTTVYSTPTGFLSLSGNNTYTQGSIHRNCVATDRQTVPTMRYGFGNEKPPTQAIVSYENCESSGHTIARMFYRPTGGANTAGDADGERCFVTLSSADQSIPDTTTTEIVWDTEQEDLKEMHDLVTSAGRVTIKRPGYYSVSAQVFWNSSATGVRSLFIQKNGSNITGAWATTSGQANNHSQAFNWPTVRLVAGDTIGVAVSQTSGGALAAKSANNQTFLIVQRVG